MVHFQYVRRHMDENVLNVARGNESELAFATALLDPIPQDVDRDPDERAEQETEIHMRLVHRNLGHPSARLMARVLKEAGAPQSAIDSALRFKCAVCERMRKTEPARPANVNRARQLGECIHVDFSYLKLHDDGNQDPNEFHKCILGHSVDEASRMHACKIIKTGQFKSDRAIGNVNATECKDFLQYNWIRFFFPEP